MKNKDAKNIISSYRRKQKAGPYIVGGLAILLAVAGIGLLVFYLLGAGDGIQISLFSTDTPTPTETPTPTSVTPTPTATMTPTPTDTPTITPTSSPSAPFEYEVQEGDNCTTIAEEFEVDISVLLVLNNLTSSCFITPGQVILIPVKGQALPTVTPIPDDFVAGTVIEHIVRPGDSLYALAERLNSDIDRIIAETNRYRRANNLREIEDSTDLFVGDLLLIPVNIVAPPPTPTNTPTPET